MALVASVDPWAIIGAVAVVTTIGAGFVHSWRSAELANEGTGPILYQAPVSAWIRTPAMGTFNMLRSGTRSLILTVRDDTISIRHSFPRHVAATLNLDHTLRTPEVMVDPDDEVLSLRRHAVALYGDERSGPVAFAIRPTDGDLQRLREALTLAGTRAPRLGPDNSGVMAKRSRKRKLPRRSQR